jgi:integrase
VRNAKPKDKPYDLRDGLGLRLHVTPSGGKNWLLDYTRPGGARNTISFGSYPAISLADARLKRDEAKRSLAARRDPSDGKKAIKQQNESDARTFEVVAREWHFKNCAVWSKRHSDTVKTRLERDVFPAFGSTPVASLKRSSVLELMKKIEIRSWETAKRVKQYCDQILRYAVNNGWLDVNPLGDLKIGDILTKKESKHHAAIIDPLKLGEFLRAVDEYGGTFTIKCILKLVPLLFQRSSEICRMRWEEIDFDKSEWRYRVNKTKTDYVVPLSTQAVEILNKIKQIAWDSPFVFASERSRARPVTIEAVLAAYRRLGFAKDEVTTHGFRATARTLLDEELGFRVDIIEHQLAHAVKDPLGRAYNRTSHLEERKRMMQEWADYLDKLKVTN